MREKCDNEVIQPCIYIMSCGDVQRERHCHTCYGSDWAMGWWWEVRGLAWLASTCVQLVCLWGGVSSAVASAAVHVLHHLLPHCSHPPQQLRLLAVQLLCMRRTWQGPMLSCFVVMTKVRLTLWWL